MQLNESMHGWYDKQGEREGEMNASKAGDEIQKFQCGEAELVVI